MAEFKLKDAYSILFFNEFCYIWQELDSHFNPTDFKNKLFVDSWPEMELKDRMHWIATCMHPFLPDDFKKASAFLVELLNALKSKGLKVSSYEYLFFPDYIEQYGQNDLKASLEAIYQVTQFVSCEFAIRPLILKDEKTVLSEMLSWSKDSNENVRRLSSEGCRPKLPWSFQLKPLVQDPGPIIPILENLKEDESLFVRKSVANNLNDISKDHPQLVLNLCESWKNENNNTRWIIKHACRTLLKKGNQRALKLFGYGDNKTLSISPVKLKSSQVELGSELSFSFNLENLSDQEQLTRIEYALYFLKSNGQHNKKVFKISEKYLAAKTSDSMTRQHKIVDLSTRKHHRGVHFLSLIVNGIEIDKVKFILN